MLVYHRRPVLSLLDLPKMLDQLGFVNSGDHGDGLHLLDLHNLLECPDFLGGKDLRVRLGIVSKEVHVDNLRLLGQPNLLKFRGFGRLLFRFFINEDRQGVFFLIVNIFNQYGFLLLHLLHL